MTEVLAHHLSSLPSSNSSSSSSAVASTDPVSNPLQALVSAVQHWLQQTRSHSGSNTGSSSSSSCLKQLFGNEVCALCASNIVFQPYDDHSEETSAQEASTSRFPPKVKGASVLYGTCETCTMRVERCCFSLRLVTTSAEDCGVSTTGAGVVRQNAVAKRMSEKVYRCELCSAVTSLALYRTVSAPGSLVQNGSSLFCPYCSIPMYPL